MKRALANVAVVASLHQLAPCQASTGWGGSGSTTGAGGAWSRSPPNGPPSGPPQSKPGGQQINGQQPHGLYTHVPPEGDGLNKAIGDYRDQHRYDPHPQQQQQQQQPPPPYDASYIPQQSPWAGQHQHHYYEQHDQRQFPRHEHDGYPPPSGSHGGSIGQPLYLGTKWRSIVSRVKDAVRPGQPPPSDYGRAWGYGTGYGGGGGGGGGNGGWVGGEAYYRPGPSWVGVANQNEVYNPPPDVRSGPAHSSTNAGYGGVEHEQRHGDGQAAAATEGFDGYLLGGGGGGGATAPFENDQQHHAVPPTTYFHPPEDSAQAPGPPQQTQALHLYGNIKPDGNDGEGGYNAGNNGGYGGSGGVAGTTIREGHGEATGGGLPKEDPSFEPTQAAAPPVVGRGWSTGVKASIPVVGPDRGLAATSEGVAQDKEPEVVPVIRDSAPSPPCTEGPEGSGPPVEAAGPPSAAAIATPSEISVEPSKFLQATGAPSGNSDDSSSSSSSSSSRITTRQDDDRGSIAAMPDSTDREAEVFDWGEGAGEVGGEYGQGDQGGSGEPEYVPGTEMLGLEREEEALMFELERMDSGVGNGGDPLDVGGDEAVGPGCRGGSSQPLSSTPTLLEDQAMIDEAVEHQLDDIFDSILDDVGSNGEVGEDEPAAHDRRTVLPSEAGSSASEEAVQGEGWGSFDGAGAGIVRKQSAEPWQQMQTANDDTAPFGGEEASPREVSSATSYQWVSATAGAGGDGEREPVWVGSPSSAANAAQASEATTSIPGVDATTSAGSDSLWGNPRRWQSLPPQPAAEVSDPDEAGEGEAGGMRRDLKKFVADDHQQDNGEEGEEGAEEEEEEDEEEDEDVGSPLDPIELPPSAATDEIWNDQHLQDQLDAYWEQSRRGGVAATPAPAGAQQLSAYGVEGREPSFQPTYGPGDWVGRSASGSGGGALLPEPLPGSAVPRLFHGGNQAPINIYGDVHVHHHQGGGDQQQQQHHHHEGRGGPWPPPPASGLSARERYYSQGETTWSGSERGGQ